MTAPLNVWGQPQTVDAKPSYRHAKKAPIWARAGELAGWAALGLMIWAAAGCAPVAPSPCAADRPCLSSIAEYEQ